MPEKAKELVLICDDPDAPGHEPWVHWVIYKIPAGVKGLPEGIPRKPRLTNPAGTLQGENSWPSDNMAIAAPCRPREDTSLLFQALCRGRKTGRRARGWIKRRSGRKSKSTVIAEGQLMGTYER